MKQFNKMFKDGLECIDAIVDPVEKVKAIAALLPFAKDYIEEAKDVATSEVAKSVVEEVVKPVVVNVESEPVKAEEPKEEVVVTEVTEVAKPVAKPVKKAFDMNSRIYKEDEFLKVKAFVKQYGNLVINDAVKENKEIAEFIGPYKGIFGRLAMAIAKHFPNKSQQEVAMIVVDHAKQVQKELKDNNVGNMTISNFFEFYGYACILMEIYAYDEKTVTDCFAVMSNGMRTNGTKEITNSNCRALLASLEDKNVA